MSACRRLLPHDHGRAAVAELSEHAPEPVVSPPSLSECVSAPPSGVVLPLPSRLSPHICAQARPEPQRPRAPTRIRLLHADQLPTSLSNPFIPTIAIRVQL